MHTLLRLIALSWLGLPALAQRDLRGDLSELLTAKQALDQIPSEVG